VIAPGPREGETAQAFASFPDQSAPAGWAALDITAVAGLTPPDMTDGDEK
jgi:hypothetical protein